MLSEFCRVSELEDDDFVGLRFEGANPRVVFPRGYSIAGDERQLRRDILRLLGAISKFSGHREGERVTNRIGNETLSFPYLSYQYVILDYLSHGLYRENDVKYEVSQRGKINWKKTIQQQQPQIDGENAVYLGFVVKKNCTKRDSLLTRIHEYCVYRSFEMLGWLLVEKELMPPKPSHPLNKRLFLATLRQTLSNTFNEQKRLLLQAMMNIVAESAEGADNDQCAAFGVERFDHVWEGMVDFVFGDEGRERFNPFSTWNIPGRQGFRSSELRPDSVVRTGDRLFILDAKYYKYGVTRNPTHLPSTDSIQKQITYGEYAESLDVVPRDKIYNAFVLPFRASSDTPYEFVAVGTAAWKAYNTQNPAYDYVVAMLVDTTYLLRTYSKHNLREIEELTTLIEESLLNYRREHGLMEE